MPDITNTQAWINLGDAVRIWALEYIFTFWALAQIAVLGVAIVLAGIAARRVVAAGRPLLTRMELPGWVPVIWRAVSPQLRVLIWLVLTGIAFAGFQALAITAELPQGPEILRVAVALITAWVVIHLATTFIEDRSLSTLVSMTVWTVAALAILGLLGPVSAVLDGIGFNLGELRISLLSILEGLMLLGGLLWLAFYSSTLLERRLAQIPAVDASMRVLLGKALRISFVTIAILVALTSVGIDFTAIAVFSGALGVGIGFGLQRIVSNLISGFILLVDRSIKPGDIIEVGGAYGWIDKLGARYTSIVTRDGKEFLIPNETLITEQVVNWSFSNRAVRLHIPVGVSYDSDLHKAIALTEEAANDTPRVLKSPPAVCRVTGFGDSAVDLDLRIWVTDPEAGVEAVSSDVRLKLWDLFHAHGVKFPFPQRDVHVYAADDGATMLSNTPSSSEEQTASSV